MSESLIPSFLVSDVSESLRSLTSLRGNERLWANCSGRSEWIPSPAKIGGCLSHKWAQKWPKKGLTLLFNYLKCYLHIFSILLYYVRLVQDLVLQIGQENYLRPGNSNIILLAFRSKLMKFPTKDDLSCLVLFIVIYFKIVPITILSKLLLGSYRHETL